LNSKPDYYAILGATADASAREIERQYKRQAHKRHPDRGGTEDDMKALNEAYGVLRDKDSRTAYDKQRQQRPRKVSDVRSAPAAREVGVYGQLLSALLCLVLGLMLLLLVRFNGLWFLWPLSILAAGVIVFGVMMAHSAMSNARRSLRESHPARRFRAAQEVAFWLIVACGGYGIYLILIEI
jgi:curved DNA-binding protein CbpA